MALTVVVINADGSATTRDVSDGVPIALPGSAQRAELLFNGIPIDPADLTLTFTPPGESHGTSGVTVTLPAPHGDQEIALTGNIETLFAPAAGDVVPDPGSGRVGENNPSTYNEASFTEQMTFGSGGGGAGPEASTRGDGLGEPASVFFSGEVATPLMATVETESTLFQGTASGDPIRAQEARETGTRSVDDAPPDPSAAAASPAPATIEVLGETTATAAPPLASSTVEAPPLAGQSGGTPPVANPDSGSVTELGSTGAASGAGATAGFLRADLDDHDHDDDHDYDHDHDHDFGDDDFVLGPTAIPQGGFGPGKWGSLPFGTGATVTWSLMPSGVATDGGTTSVALSSFMPVGFEAEIVRAFDAWSAVSNITFVQVADSGLPFNAFGATGDIRVGGHAFDGPFGTLAHGFFPPLNGASAAGDIHFDIAETWVIGFAGSGFDIFQVMAHEIGHAIGLDHETDVVALMNPFYTETFSGLQPDDVAGGQFIYGRNVPTGNVLANDSEGTGGSLTVSAISGGGVPGGAAATGAFGSLLIATDGGYTYELDDSNSTVDALDFGESLVEVFTYSISDGAASASSTLSITINGANDAPLGNDDANAITELLVSDDATPNFVTGDVLLNDSDADVEALTVSAISGGGTPDGAASTGAFGTLQISAGGGYTYELDDSNTAVDAPTFGETLIEAFTYTITDGDAFDTATLSITINGANTPPVANLDANSITELMVSDDLTGNAVTGDVLANDSDIDNQPLTVSALSGGTVDGATANAGTFGALTIAANGSYTYELDDSHSAVDALDDGETLIEVFTYSITDGIASDTSALIITINGANDAPEATPDRDTIAELMVSDDLTGNSVTGEVLSNDSDVDVEPLTVSSISGGGTPGGAAATGAFGTLLIAAGGSYTYELDDANSAVDALGPGQTLIEVFTYTSSDGDKSDSATLSITINGTLELTPVARADSNAITELMANGSEGEDTAGPNRVTGDVLANDSEAKDGPLTVSAISGGGTPGGTAATGAFGALTIAADGGYSYELDETNSAVDALNDGETLIEVFTYSASDGAQSVTSTLAITINGANDAPAPGPTGTAITELMVSDDATANVVTGDAVAGAGTVSGLTGGAFGALTIDAGGSYTYELDDANTTVDALDDGETLIDSFTFTVADGGSSSSETLDITIHGANDPPLANPDVNAITELAVSDDATPNFVTGDVLANDSDVDVEALTVSAVAGRGGSEGNPAQGTVGGTTQGAFGSLTLLANGSYTYELDDANAEVNALNPAETLVEVFTYSLSDGGKSDSATLAITISGLGEASPAASPDSNALTELMVSDDATANVVTGDVLANDGQGTGGDLTVSAISGGGTPGGTASTGAFGALTILANGSYTYELDDANSAVDALDDGESLIEVFTYSASDGAASITSTLSITINGANDAPVASPDGNTLTELMVSNDLTSNFVTGDVLSNDSDVDVEALTVSGVSGGGSPRSGIPATGSFGSLSLDPSGAYTYELDDANSAVDALGAGETLIEVFTYSITDGDKGATSTLAITINGALENAILARDDSSTIDIAGNTVAGDVLANDSQAKGGPLTVSAISGGGTPGGAAATGAFGSLNITAGGGYTYDVDESNATVSGLGDGETLIEVFTYSVTDGAQSDSATLSITIDNPNDAPVANADRGTITELMVSDDGTANSVTGNVLANDTDSEPLTVSGVGGADPRSGPFIGAYGTLLIAPGGSYTYELDDANSAVDALELGETLVDVFTYSAFDGNSSASATLNITINGALELAPVARSDSNAITEQTGSSSGGEDTSGPNRVSGDVLANDSEATAGPLTVSAISGGGTPGGGAATGAFGALTIAADGGYSYLLDEANSAVDALNDGETLIEVFTYSASDGAQSVTATLSITINGANDAPAPGPTGTAVTELMVSDDATANFVTGDAVAGSGTVSGLTGGSFGALTIAAGGSYTYELDDANTTVDALDDGETLIDSFTFTVTDGGSSSSETLDITIHGANDPPLANPDVNAITELAVSDDATPNFVTGDVLANDSDVDVEALTVSAVAGRGGSEGSPAQGTVGGETQGAFGSLTLLANGSYTYELDDANAEVNALAPAETLVEVFTYSLSDGGKTDTATLAITITGVGETSAAASPDSNAITELMVSDDATANFVTGAVLANDSQGTGGALTASAISGGGAFGNLTIFASGNYTYELDDADSAVDALDDGETLIEVYTYSATDGAQSVTSTLSITINGVNDAPVASPDGNAITELMVSDDATPNFITGDVLTNDSDVDIEALTVSGVSGGGSPRAGVPATGAFGSLTLDPSGAYTYELDDANSAVNALGAGETLIEVFTYSITDGDKGATSTLSITINGALENAILARDDSNAVTISGNIVTGDVLANDSQGAGGPLTVSAISGGGTPGGAAATGAFGALNIAAAGGYTYDVDESNTAVSSLGNGETLIEVFTYSASDGAQSDSSTLSITIANGNVDPIANPDVNAITELMVSDDATPNNVTGDVLANDEAGSGGALTVSAISGGGAPGSPGGGVEATGAFGSLNIISSGGYTYELDDANTAVDALNNGETLIDSFTYTASDGTETVTSTLSITINGTFDPVASEQSAAAQPSPLQLEDVLSSSDTTIDLGDSGGAGGPLDPGSPNSEPPIQFVDIGNGLPDGTEEVLISA